MSPLSATHEIQSKLWFIWTTYKTFHHCVEGTLMKFLNGRGVIVDVLNGRDEFPNPAWDMLDYSIRPR
jgi:hypothetical protein